MLLFEPLNPPWVAFWDFLIDQPKQQLFHLLVLYYKTLIENILEIKHCHTPNQIWKEYLLLRPYGNYSQKIPVNSVSPNSTPAHTPKRWQISFDSSLFTKRTSILFILNGFSFNIETGLVASVLVLYCSNNCPTTKLSDHCQTTWKGILHLTISSKQ